MQYAAESFRATGMPAACAFGLKTAHTSMMEPQHGRDSMMMMRQ